MSDHFLYKGLWSIHTENKISMVLVNNSKKYIESNIDIFLYDILTKKTQKFPVGVIRADANSRKKFTIKLSKIKSKGIKTFKIRTSKYIEAQIHGNNILVV